MFIYVFYDAAVHGHLGRFKSGHVAVATRTKVISPNSNAFRVGFSFASQFGIPATLPMHSPRRPRTINLAITIAEQPLRRPRIVRPSGSSKGMLSHPLEAV
jgi:hypothetical protein